MWDRGCCRGIWFRVVLWGTLGISNVFDCQECPKDIIRSQRDSWFFHPFRAEAVWPNAFVSWARSNRRELDSNRCWVVDPFKIFSSNSIDNAGFAGVFPSDEHQLDSLLCLQTQFTSLAKHMVFMVMDVILRQLFLHKLNLFIKKMKKVEINSGRKEIKI